MVALRWVSPFAFCLLFLCCIPTTSSSAPAEKKPKPAKLKVSGYGVLGNFQLKRSLSLLNAKEKAPEYYDANFVEDAVMILFSRVREDGHLEPTITSEITLDDGSTMHHEWKEALEHSLPRPLRIRKVRFRIRKGVLFHYQDLQIKGVESIPQNQARSYFIESGFLLHLKSSRIYTPARLDRGISSLTEVLQRQGYEEVQAVVSHLELNHKSGAVNAEITVKQGLKSVVRYVRKEFVKENETTPYSIHSVFPNKPYSRLWAEDFRQQLRTNSFHRGYPDTKIDLQTLKRETNANLVELDMAAQVKQGPQVTLGKIDFQGEDKTRESMMRRRVRVKEGTLLDRIKVEKGRSRLAQLGIFESVTLRYDKVDEHERNVTYEVKEGKDTHISLLFGYGSYELLRGGIEVDQHNIWGRAHNAHLKLVQSFKASIGEYTYTMPELIGNDVDVFFNASALRRQEISFLREEYGGGFGVHKFFRSIATDVTSRYSYQILNAADTPSTVFQQGVQNPNVGTIITDIKHDRRDNPLYPRRGYKAYLNFELGSEYLGGDVNYQRLVLSGSYHHPIGNGRWMSIGLSQGTDFTIASPALDLPFNRRFFPGGENSIRGYREGQASPRNAQGEFIGAETFTLATVEFEQALTPKWSVVLFSDNLGTAENIENYPFNAGLFSVGGGLRWRTIIGPVRAEYGYNLNPREGDPQGTFHFSLGFPF